MEQQRTFHLPTRRWAILSLALALLLGGLLAARATLRATGPTADATPCVGGMAGEYPCRGVDLLAFLPLSELGASAGVEAANLWGWTDPTTGREYVLLGLSNATAFVDVTDPTAPLYLGQLPTHTGTSTYRDIKVYADHAFVVADAPSSHGIQVFDLTQLRGLSGPPVTFEESAHSSLVGNVHNLTINEATGVLYAARTTSPDLCGGTLAMIDVRDPLAPAWLGCYEHDGLASDAMCVIYEGPDHEHHGRELCVVASDNAIVVGDVTDRSAPEPLARVTYPHIARAHHLWLTEDHRYFLSSDMHDEHHHGLNTRIFVWDFSDVDAPTLAGTYVGPTTATDHNVWIRDGYAYVGNFRAGLRILDLAAIESGTLTEAAFFDMVPADDDAGHEGGAWAAYPFFPSGTLAVSDKEAGLFLVRRNWTLWLPAVAR